MMGRSRRRKCDALFFDGQFLVCGQERQDEGEQRLREVGQEAAVEMWCMHRGEIPMSL